MMDSILFECLLIFFLLLCNGVLAMSEIAVVTSRRSRLVQKAKEGSTGAQRALALLDDPTRFLSTVQVGITLIGVLAGAFGGATIARELDLHFEQIPAIAAFSETIAIAVVVGAISFSSLVIGELVPKRIAMQAPERIAAYVAAPMQIIARFAAPVVTILTLTTRALLRLLRVPETKGTLVTEEEIRATIAEGRQSGVVQHAEHEMLEGVFRVGDRLVWELMVPRPDVDWIDLSKGSDAWREALRSPNAEGILVCRGFLDEVVGVIHLRRLLPLLLDGSPVDPVDLADPALFVPGSMEIPRLLERFKQTRQRMAVVLDEFGGVEGIITLDGVLEEIVGDLPSLGHPDGEGESEFVARPDGTWLVDGAVEFEEISTRFGLPPVPLREDGNYRTLAGFVIARLGRMPHAGDRFLWGEIGFEVVDMDGRRVDKVLVTPLPKSLDPDAD
jgi:putative hemolysin